MGFLASFLRHVFAAVALTLSVTPAWGADAGLFIPLSATDAALFAHSAVSPAPSADGQPTDGQAPTNGWLVRIDRKRLFQTIHGVAKLGSGSLLLNVAEGVEFDFVVERTQRTLSGHSLSGRVAGVAGSAVTFVAHAEVVMGTVWTPSAAYELVPLKDGVHVFRKVDPSARPRLGEPIKAEGGLSELRSVDQANADGDSVVDVLVLWTPKAQENADGEAQMRAGIELAVAWTNDAYERSGADVRLNLVGAELVDYVEQGPGCMGRACRSIVDLHRLANPSDGFMDGAHRRRDALGADLVSLFTGDGDVGGIAMLPGAFSVVIFTTSWPNLAFAHELGHNMGLSHDRYEAGGEGLLSFSFGYVNKLAFEPGAAHGDCWKTIMAYSDRCFDNGFENIKGVPYFSTPDRRYPDNEGSPLGVPKSSDQLGADGPADAVYALNLSLPRVSTFSSKNTDDGDTAKTATPLVSTSTTDATLANADDIDYFRIELPEAGWLRVETTSNDGRVMSALTTEDGALVAKGHIIDASSSFPETSQIAAELEAGVYFITVEPAPGEQYRIDYTLVVSFNPASAEDDHGDGAEKATVAAVPSTTSGELQNPSDTDYFRFEVSERGVVRVGTTGETDVVGVLISEDGAVRLTDDDGGTATNFLIVAKLDPGVYFVAVRGFGGDATGPYSLDLSFSPLSEALDDHADSPDGATDLAVGSSASGELEVALDRDHFRIEVPGAGLGILLVKSKGDMNVKGTLLSQDGVLLEASSFGGEYYNFVLDAHVAPGTYMLRVDGRAGSDIGAYELEVSFTADSRAIPLFISTSHPMRQGFARIINRSDRPGAAAIHAVDDAGERRGPVTLSLAAGQTAHFNSSDLEAGNPAKGLSGGVGVGEGDWRLELATDLDIEALAYVRTADGFLTGMNEVATYNENHYSQEVAVTFNPASNRTQVSRLRLINPGPSSNVPLFLSGYDDRGNPSEGSVFMQLQGSSAAHTINAQSLEAGGDSLNGRLGDGDGKWRLHWFSPARLLVRAMSLLQSPTGHLTNLTSRAEIVGRQVSLPLFISASNSAQQGFARIINRGHRSSTVNIHAIDGAGRRRGPVTLSLDAGQATHFNSDDLEMGNAAKGLSGGLGAGEGDWRLELAADVDIEALAYVRTSDGFLTSMNALAPQSNGRHEVVIFNPASNDRQVSKLRLINPADSEATITVSGVDDAGAAPPEGEVTLTVPAGASAEITAQQLEAGAAHFKGRFGDGKGKWRLFIEADQDIQAMSLLVSPTGHITNLSSGTAVR